MTLNQGWLNVWSKCKLASGAIKSLTKPLQFLALFPMGEPGNSINCFDRVWYWKRCLMLSAI